MAVNRRGAGQQTRWTHWRQAGHRSGVRALSRRSPRLVKKATRSAEEETSTNDSPFRENHSGSPAHTEVLDSQSEMRGAGLSSKSQCEPGGVDRQLLGSAEKVHTCAQCGESWSHLIDFLSHQMGSCQDRPHRCGICGKAFMKRQHLMAHRKTHTEDRPFSCNQCGKSFRQSSTLTTHLWSHAGHKPFHCTFCPKSFSRKPDLVAHMRRHTGERPYQCPYCLHCFIRKKSLQRHMLKHAGEDLRTGWEQSYPSVGETSNCPETEECPMQTPHTPPHTNPADEDPVTFDDVAVCFSEEEWKGLQDQQKDLYCQVMTDNYENLSALGLSEAPPEIVLKIGRGEDPCVDKGEETAGNMMVNRRGAGYQTRWRRAGHRSGVRAVSRRSPRLVKKATRSGEEETSTKDSPFRENHSVSPAHTEVLDSQSETRGTVLSSEPDGVDHERSELGSAEKVHTCAQCGESWSHLIDFLSHQMGSCQDRPHRCGICGKAFMKRQHLMAHRKTHTEDRPFSCNQCGKSFRQNSTLTTHLWSHAGHKPFHCTFCPKNFSRKPDLVAHMRRHTGERPYQCPYCLHCFIRKKSLQRHMLKHAGEDLRTGWEQSYPSLGETSSCPETEECPMQTPHTPPHTNPADEVSFSRGPEDKTDTQSEDSPLLASQEYLEIMPLQEVKEEAEEEKPPHSPDTCNDRATQTEPQNTRPDRMQQQVLRELRRCRKRAARAQQERDYMRAAMDHLMQEMKVLKDMVGTLCSVSAGAPAPPLPAAPAHNPCLLMSDPLRCAESGRASPESSLQCIYRSPLDMSRDVASCVFGNPPDAGEDDMLPTTTIKREEEPSRSPEFPYYRHPQNASQQSDKRLPDIAMHSLTPEKEWALLARSAGKPGRFAALVFRALVPFDVYKSWVDQVNLDGARGRKGIPLNVKQRVMATVERHFNLRKCDHSEVRNRLSEQLRTRRKSDKLTQPLYQPGVPY